MARNIRIGIFIIVILSIVAAIGVSVRTEASVLNSITGWFEQYFVSQPSSIEVVEKKDVPLYKPVLDYEEAVVRAVETTNPSVVSIIITKDLPIIEQCAYDPFGDVPPGFQDLFREGFRFEFQRPCQKGTERREIGGGTGFVVSEDGLIVTNKHVVLDEDADYTVLTNDGERYDAQVVARNPVRDIAILRVENVDLMSIVLGNSDTIKLGQTAIAIGNALGEFRNTVSVGVISGLARTITASGNGFVEIIEGVIQTDAAINQGNSGGPLINLQGEVIGINTAVARGAQGIGFAIPINFVTRDIISVQQTGTITVPFLGVRYISITPDFAKEQDLPVKYGALIRGTEGGPAIIPNSPASEAGLRAEDTILEIGGMRIERGSSLGTLIQRHNVGDVVSLIVLRDGERIIISVTLAERPDL